MLSKKPAAVDKTRYVACSGFIGLEMAENLVEMGVSVTIIQRPKQLLASLDGDMASFVHAEMRRHGVALRLGETVTGFRQDGDSVLTLLEGSEPLHSDMVLLAIGVTLDTHLAKEAGLKLGIRGSIAVNEQMETSVPDIYAVRDSVEVSHFVTGQKALISLAGPANKQGRIAADNICGGNSRFYGSQGSSVLKLFSLTAASTGINEKAAQAAGIAYDKVVLFPASHATYYPGAQSMAMKVLYEKESLRLLGVQIVGGDGVDKRIDVLATAIRAKMTALELTGLDLSYAPPYSSAKDPVNIAGFMIEDLEFYGFVGDGEGTIDCEGNLVHIGDEVALTYKGWRVFTQCAIKILPKQKTIDNHNGRVVKSYKEFSADCKQNSKGIFRVVSCLNEYLKSIDNLL